ncbi:hemicentin-1-like [Stylophora pistillata]|uniref:hemicentin-1-like n=1 Tax=Stylophora pistillata TaxID=50429 RepID=UPI000C038FDC|nr:hemicentin-1-like [Stylophora pistillata]
MEEGWLAIFLCTLFVFSAEGVPSFTTKPQKTFHAVQGENITLEWKYTFSKGESFRQALFVMGNLQVADKHAVDSTPWIRNAYRGRLYVNITNHYTSITLLRVKRADKGSYALEVITNPDRDRNSSTVEISVLYLDLPNISSTDTRPVEGSDVTLSCNVSGEPMPTISWTMNGSPLDTSDNSRISFMEDNKNLIIANVNRRDSGEYQCVANNSLGNVSSNTSTLSVQYHPAVALNPLNAAKAEGENITWSCNASGNPEPTISWIFNASLTKTNSNPRIVFSRDRQKMTITILSRKDSGEYQCIAINNLGNASSQVASLDVTYIPEITVHPKNVTKKEGENATLNCNAMGNPVPKISWNKGGSPLGNTSSISLSADNKDLTIKNVNRVDSGEYRCVATNSLGNDTSNPAYLGVQFKPEIGTVPRLIQRTEGDELSLFCNATGNPVPLISWTKNGFSLDTSNNSRINFSNKGKQLTIKNLSKRDGGVYLCVAENSLGNATSHGATLEVHFEPEVSIDGNQKQYVAKGGNIRLICWYEASPPVSEVQWRKEGTVIVRNASKLINGSRVTIPSFNESQVQLSITEASLRDEGNYTCNASNIFSSTQDTIMIIIEDKPEIAAHPHNFTTEEGHDVTLYCNATGNPAPTISWTKYGNPISNGSRIILSPSHEQLTITNVNRIDSGKYKCQAKNRVGTDTSFVSTVTVYFAPEISIPPRNVTVVKGEHVTFTCSVAGNPTPSVIWTKNGKDLDVTANSPLKLSSRKHNHSLEIAEVDLSDSGQYICVANSSQGKLSSSAATLTVQLPSEAPSFVVTVLNSTAVNVSWQECSLLHLILALNGS